MPPACPARSARRLPLLAPLWLLAGAAHADIGGTLSVQSDARERGVSYSNDKPGAQVGLAWDGPAGWYGGAALTQARFDKDRQAGWLRAYGGRVGGLRPGLDAEIGLVAHRFAGVSRYDYLEGYVGLLGERWNVRLHHAPDHYGSGQRAVYGEFNLRWPLAAGIAAVGHVGALKGHGEPRWPLATYGGRHGPTRIDLRAGLAWQLGEHADLQLAWVSVSRGGPVTWTTASTRRTAVLGLSVAF
ncbi:MAG: hypothetical protein EOP35_17875 [Rubrivivax sp.]|nr:MAG: hypothetical protein EOP35_17875 [Rubrivivax sp.]